MVVYCPVCNLVVPPQSALADRTVVNGVPHHLRCAEERLWIHKSHTATGASNHLQEKE